MEGDTSESFQGRRTQQPLQQTSRERVVNRQHQQQQPALQHNRGYQKA